MLSYSVEFLKIIVCCCCCCCCCCFYSNARALGSFFWNWVIKTTCKPKKTVYTLLEKEWNA